MRRIKHLPGLMSCLLIAIISLTMVNAAEAQTAPPGAFGPFTQFDAPTPADLPAGQRIDIFGNDATGMEALDVSCQFQTLSPGEQALFPVGTPPNALIWFVDDGFTICGAGPLFILPDFNPPNLPDLAGNQLDSLLRHPGFGFDENRFGPMNSAAEFEVEIELIELSLSSIAPIPLSVPLTIQEMDGKIAILDGRIQNLKKKDDCKRAKQAQARADAAEARRKAAQEAANKSDRELSEAYRDDNAGEIDETESAMNKAIDEFKNWVRTHESIAKQHGANAPITRAAKSNLENAKARMLDAQKAHQKSDKTQAERAAEQRAKHQAEADKAAQQRDAAKAEAMEAQMKCAKNLKAIKALEDQRAEAAAAREAAEKAEKSRQKAREEAAARQAREDAAREKARREAEEKKRREAAERESARIADEQAEKQRAQSDLLSRHSIKRVDLDRKGKDLDELDPTDINRMIYLQGPGPNLTNASANEVAEAAVLKAFKSDAIEASVLAVGETMLTMAWETFTSLVPALEAVGHMVDAASNLKEFIEGMKNNKNVTHRREQRRAEWGIVTTDTWYNKETGQYVTSSSVLFYDPSTYTQRAGGGGREGINVTPDMAGKIYTTHQYGTVR